jgi:hypothetical protein
MSASQAQDFIDVWRVIGTILGLPTAAMPPTVAQTRHLGDVLNARPEDIGAAAKNYVAGNIAAQAKFFDPPVPSTIGGPFFAALTRKTPGTPDADVFGIPWDRFWDSVADAALPALAGGVPADLWPSAATLYAPMLATVLRMMLDDAKNADFVLPPSFHPAG